MKRYESYKDSGVKWLGEIPGHWEVTCLRRLLKRYSVKGHPNKPLLSVTREKGVILRGAKGDDGNNNIIPEELSGYKHVKKGQFVINKMKSWQGSYGVSDFEGIVSPAYFVYDLDIADKRFFSWAIRSKNYVPFFMQYSKGIRVDQWDLTPENVKSIPFFIPPKSEQTAIANYLDSVTSKIDEAISQQQKMIDLLNERKQIIIQNAVTKGLDPNAKMKDSGVEWIGEIPEDWEVRPIKTLLKLKKKLVGSKSNQYNLLSLSIDGIKIRDLNNPMGKFPTSFDTYQEVNKNDFVFCNFDNEETPRAVGLSKVHGMITGAYDVMVLYDLRVDIEYLYLVFLDIDNFKKFKPLYKGLRKTVPYDSFMSYKIAIPPFEEQREISESLLVFLKNIDSSISQCNKMISLLQERKQIIINDVVTGKVKVV